MALIWTNATLSRIARAGSGDAYDADPVVGPDRWTGSVGVTLRERHVEQIAGGRLDRVDETHLILPYTIGAQVQQGDTLIFSFEGATHTRKAGTIVRAEKTGRVRIGLENA
jgi:hypothetical protein